MRNDLKTCNVETIKEHPFKSHIPINAKYLIIGTFPTHQKNYKMTFPFYYAGEGNRFWPIMEQVFRTTFKFYKGEDAVEERKKFLDTNLIGITDMITMCYRINGRSQDQHIYPIKLNNIFDILDTSESIETIILTSRTKVIGALGLLETYFLQNNLDPPICIKNADNILKGNFKRGNRELEILVPYSTSKSTTNKISIESLVSMYRCCLT